MVKLSDEQKATFCDYLRQMPVISDAARKIGVPPSVITANKKQDHLFELQCEEALEEGKDIVEKAMLERGVYGVKSDIYYNGEVVGEETKYSDSLLAKLAKGYRPKLFGESSKVEVSGKLETNLPEEEINKRVLDLLLKAKARKDNGETPCV